MKVLITNDDGIDARGVRELAVVARDAGHEVVVAAPSGERSGASASLSALEDDGRMVMRSVDLDLDGVRAYGVEASPAMIAFVGCRGGFGPEPDLVLSGINHGPNTGFAILHSGTVGAALTAAGQGIPALALSFATADPTHWDTARVASRRALDWIAAHGQAGWVLNVNIPDVPTARGVRPAGLAAFGAVQAGIRERGEDYVAVTLQEIHADDRGDDTDASLLRGGWVTATVLRSPWRDADIDLSGLEIEADAAD